MSRNTGGYFGINEALFSSALAAIVFSTLAAQPITIVGITGLISLFNYTIYHITLKQHIGDLYPEFIAWVSIWAAITHWIASIGNLCDYMRYITDFSSNSFGMYVGIIYMSKSHSQYLDNECTHACLVKGIEELIDQFNSSTATAGFLSVVVALCYWATVYALELLPKTIMFKAPARKFLSDYAYPVSGNDTNWKTSTHSGQICTIFWSGFVHINGPIKRADVLKLPITKAFYPTTDRDWLVRFWNLPVRWVFVALPIGILLTMLFYYDHVSTRAVGSSAGPVLTLVQNVSSIGAQAKHFPLTKPSGFHWDFFLLGCTCFVGGILGLPLPNGLVPQAPVHTDSLTEYKDKLVITHEDEDGQIVEHRHKIIVAEKVVEQRLSHFLMGLAIIGTMTGPLLIVLHTMPRCLFAGVFLVVGWGSIEGNGITAKVLFLLKEHRFIDPADPLLKVRKRQILLFILWQILGVGFSVALSQTIGAIGFPVIILALIPLRWNIYPRWFTREELGIMDAPTADSGVVLASFGGKPEMPEDRLEREKNGNRNFNGEEGGTNGSGTSEERVDEEDRHKGKRE